MFSGIIEETQLIKSVVNSADDLIISISPSFKKQCVLGQSIAIQGICLTVFKIQEDILFYLSPETLSKTNQDYWQLGQTVNIERSLKMGDSIDGHLVSGHVDGLIKIISIKQIGEAHEVTFEVSNPQQMKLVYPKGSIAIDGISLTINEIGINFFKVMIIPHTWQNTNTKNWFEGQFVHVEFDSMAKMIDHQLSLRNHS